MMKAMNGNEQRNKCEMEDTADGSETLPASKWSLIPQTASNKIVTMEIRFILARDFLFYNLKRLYFLSAAVNIGFPADSGRQNSQNKRIC